MLKQLSIRNIAIIDQLTLDFQEGMTVITGESGSGKSVLLDAIALAFGAKASPRDVLKTSSERGQVELIFDIGQLQGHEAFRSFMGEQGIALLPDETEILLSREFTAGGSRSRINGIPVTRDVLERLRFWVLDLHGQHELTGLFQRETQRTYLDAFAGTGLKSLKARVAETYTTWVALKRQWDSHNEQAQTRERERDFMAFQLTELEEAHLTSDTEDTEARQELEILAHAEKLIRAARQGEGILSEGDAQGPAILDQLALLEKRLSDGASYDPVLEGLLDRAQAMHAELKELASDLSRYAERVETDPARVGALTDRLDTLEKLKRKYGPTLRDVLTTRDRLAQTLLTLATDAQNLETLQTAMQTEETKLKALSAELRGLRQAQANVLKVALLSQLQVLAMPSVTFDIRFIDRDYSAEGTEDVEFLFSANPGEPLKPLAKVASGGELSRFLLAMKTLTAQTDGLLTLIFDEIDTGISGPTAKTVAEKLAGLSRRLQVIVITHQPMIAAMGRQHWHVEKQLVLDSDGVESIRVDVEALEHDETRRLQILSRLVSGSDSHDEAVEKFIRRLQDDAERFYQKAETNPSALSGQNV